MSSCSSCKTKNWTCLNCKNIIAVGDWVNKFKSEVAVYCGCCNHQYVCKFCYTSLGSKSSFNYWAPKFGKGHAVKDLMSGESKLSHVLSAIFGLKVPIDASKKDETTESQ